MRDFIQVLRERGLVHQTSDTDLPGRMAEGLLSGYVGFDATARSLHAGHLSQIMMLRWLQACGHRPIVLLGGGTSMIGDPSFRADARRMMDADEIEANKTGIAGTFARFLRFGEGGSDAAMLDNAAWLSGLDHLSFLRDVGRHFSVNRMLSFDSVRDRMTDGRSLSFLEFNYMILQAYDFAVLARDEGCVLQMGGSDQWGNIVNGIELGRRMHGLQLHAVTSPLLSTSSGAKMGKTGADVVWLDPSLTTPFDFWQYWRNCEDPDVGRFLLVFTDMPADEAARYAALGGSEINEGKVALADAVTTLVHGAGAAGLARGAAEGASVGTTTEGLPVHEVRPGDPLGVLSLCVAAGLASSNGEARRKVAEGAVRVDGTAVADPSTVMEPEALRRGARLSLGRRRHVLLRMSADGGA